MRLKEAKNKASDETKRKTRGRDKIKQKENKEKRQDKTESKTRRESPQSVIYNVVDYLGQTRDRQAYFKVRAPLTNRGPSFAILRRCCATDRPQPDYTSTLS